MRLLVALLIASLILFANPVWALDWANEAGNTTAGLISGDHAYVAVASGVTAGTDMSILDMKSEFGSNICWNGDITADGNGSNAGAFEVFALDDPANLDTEHAALIVTLTASAPCIHELPPTKYIVSASVTTTASAGRLHAWGN